MKRTITVAGQGEITLCPDTAKLTMELREEGAEHAAVTAACGARAVDAAAAHENLLLLPAGTAAEQLRTLRALDATLLPLRETTLLP